MTDVRPRWVHYRQDGFCELATLQPDGRVSVFLSGFRGRGGAAPHAPGRVQGAWHDPDECKPVPPYRSVDFATAFAAMRTGAIARRGHPGGAAWKIIDGRFCTERPDGEFLPEELYADEVAGEWYLGVAKEGSDDGA